jgi:hypothetical protein
MKRDAVRARKTIFLPQQRRKEGRISFLKKRNKKLLSVSGHLRPPGWPDAGSNG